MVIKKGIWILLILWLDGWSIAHAQLNLSAVAGGGISDLDIPLSKEEHHELLAGGLLFQVGTAISGTFRKEGMLGWQMGLMLQNSGFRSIPVDQEKVK